MTTSSAAPSSPRFLRIGSLLGATALVAGCASVPNPTPEDPWESYNRSMFAFNDTFDRALLKPVAIGYDTLMPDPAQNCVSNIFNNLEDAWSAINSFLQGRGHDFFNTLGRVLFNSTMGLGGCIDVASMNGSQRIRNDFGTTLGVWGLNSGPYVVLPFLGSSTVRDGSAFVGTFAAGVSPLTPVAQMDNVAARNALVGLYIVDVRAGLLEADKLVDDIALDRYSFIRDAFLQQRNAMVNSRREGQRAPDYSDDSLPDYSDDNLPDYSDPEDANDAAATPAAGAAQ